MTKKQRKQVREQGRQDYDAGKPITAFDEMALPASATRNEKTTLRDLYEEGWREARDAARRSE